MTDYLFTILGVLYVTFLPGFIFVEYLFTKMAFWKKVPLYFVCSIFISTYLSYITSFLFGFSRINLLFNLAIFVVLLLFKIKTFKFRQFRVYLKSHLGSVLTAAGIYLVFFTALYPGIFRLDGQDYIMSGPNWQDTAMHLSIIESLSEGNFPPQAPYFSGQPLSYYYFADLHAAIVNAMYGHFYPYVLVLLNPFFAATFFLAVYSLTYLIIKNKKAAIVAGLGSTLYGNLGYFRLIYQVLFEGGNYFELLTNNAYHLNFDSTLQMVPMADYFLQNRPMMVGLPTLVIVVFLLLDIFNSRRDNKNKYFYLRKVFLAGLLNALLLKFQFFGFAVGLVFFGIMFLVNLSFKKSSLKRLVEVAAAFLVPAAVLLVVSSMNNVGDRSVVQVVLQTFKWGAWEKHELPWFLHFILNNFGAPIIIFALAWLVVFAKKDKTIASVYFPTFFIFLIPFVIKFTIYDFDMFKFFYYALPFIFVVVVYFVYHLPVRRKITIAILVLLTGFTTLTSINMLIHAYRNKTSAYSVSQYKSGIWIRKHTAQKSVFLTAPSVHCPVTDIAGRLRVLSYVNWPHSHGFNTGEDNVFSRLRDIKTFFEASDDETITSEVLDKYKINYVYFGPDEISDFPEAENKLKSNSLLEQVYDYENIKIYKRI